MSKLVKIFASAALIAVLFSVSAEARGGYRYGGYHGGHWHGGGWGYRGGWGWGYPYTYYGGPYYYAGPPRCGYVGVRVWRHGYWVPRRVWRCW